MASRARGRKPKGADGGSQVPLPFEGEQSAAGVGQRSPDAGAVSSTLSHPLNGEKPTETAPNAIVPLPPAQRLETTPTLSPGIVSLPSGSEGSRAAAVHPDVVEGPLEDGEADPHPAPATGTLPPVSQAPTSPSGSSEQLNRYISQVPRSSVPQNIADVPRAEFGVPVTQLLELYELLRAFVAGPGPPRDPGKPKGPRKGGGGGSS